MMPRIRPCKNVLKVPIVNLTLCASNGVERTGYAKTRENILGDINILKHRCHFRLRYATTQNTPAASKNI